MYLTITFDSDKTLDPLLQEYLAQMENEEITTFEIIWLILATPIVLTNIITLVALVFSKRWAKKGFIYSTLLLFPFLFFSGITIESNFSLAIDSVITFISGILFTLLLYTDAYDGVK